MIVHRIKAVSGAWQGLNYDLAGGNAYGNVGWVQLVGPPVRRDGACALFNNTRTRKHVWESSTWDNFNSFHTQHTRSSVREASKTN